MPVTPFLCHLLCAPLQAASALVCGVEEGALLQGLVEAQTIIALVLCTLLISVARRVSFLFLGLCGGFVLGVWLADLQERWTGLGLAARLAAGYVYNVGFGGFPAFCFLVFRGMSSTSVRLMWKSDFEVPGWPIVIKVTLFCGV